MKITSGNLGRRIPTDFEHVEKYSFAALSEPPALVAERTLRLPWWHRWHDQGQTSSCVGHGVAMERAIVNGMQNKLLGMIPYSRHYDPISIWNEAKVIDEWADTNPGDNQGTSVRAGCDVARTKGVQRVKWMKLVDDVPTPQREQDWDENEGILTNRWATTVDELRTVISNGAAVAIGVNWYGAFDIPQKRPNGEWWIREDNLGGIRGGHCVTLYGVSDKRKGFKMKNSWGSNYPLVWIPYTVMERLLNE